MSKLANTKQMVFGAAMFLTLAVPAIAQDSPPANTWTNFDMTMHYSGNALSKAQRATIDAGEVIHTTSDTSPGLMFTCLTGKFYVAASVKPQNFRDTFNSSTRRHKIKLVDMRLDGGEKTSLGKWLFKPSLGGISSRKRSQAAKLYNAVIRHQEVTLYMSGKKPVTLDLPKPNRAFAEFGAECGLGKFAKKK